MWHLFHVSLPKCGVDWRVVFVRGDRHIFSQGYFVPLRMRVTHPVPRIVTVKMRHSDNYDIKSPVSLGKLCNFASVFGKGRSP